MAPPDSVHDACVAHGARGYYERFGDRYRNPHEPVVAELIGLVLGEWPVDATSVLDLAAGSGEATLAIQAATGSWCHGLVPQAVPLSGRRHGLGYQTVAPNYAAIDPYTAAAYEARTGLPCEAMTFDRIAAGGLRGRAYSLVVCSFALHLAEPSRLPTLCWELAAVAGQLLILTPHKRPAIAPAWGWSLTHERLHRRVRARLYVSQPAAKGLS